MIRRGIRRVVNRWACWSVGHDPIRMPEGVQRPYAAPQIYYGFRTVCGRCGKVLAE